MGLIKRNEKGSKLTVQELDGNLSYLESIGIGGFNQPINNVIEIEKLNNENVSGSFNSYNTDIEEIINEDVVVYKNNQYDNFDEPSYEIILKDDNGEPIELLEGESCFLDCNLSIFSNETKTGFNNLVRIIKTQSDGKILVGGNFTTRIIRLNSDSNIDDTFNIGTGFNNNVLTIQIQSDGKILVGGVFTLYNGTTSNRIIRLNSDGSIDNTFDIGDGFNLPVGTIQIQSDGKILVGGEFNTYNGTSRNNLIRLNSDGSVDNTFNFGAGFNQEIDQNNIYIGTIQIQSDGKILVGGEFTMYNETTRRMIIRLNSDGSIDNTFDIGDGFDTFVNTITLQSDGKILVGGNFQYYNGTISNRIIRLNSDGSVDNTFNIGTGFNSQVYSIQIQSDGKILVGGIFTTHNETSVNRIIRLNSDGSRDNTFNVRDGFGGNNWNDGVYSIQIQPDGKILVGGNFLSYNGISINNIIRLNSDGSIDKFNLSDNETYSVGLLKAFKKRNTQYDTNFSIGVGFRNGTFNGGAASIQVQSDGKILVSGGFDSYNGTRSLGLIRLNSDGSVDNTFNIGTGFNSNVFAIPTQSDGKILVGGWFTSYNGTTSNRIIRLNSDGTVDNTFNIGTGFNNNVQIIQVQSDGKILVGGDFTSYNGTTRNRIIRLNSDGSRDDTFSIGTGFNSFVESIEIQSDGKILVGGYFTSYNGTSRNSIIRLNPNGSRDDTFSIGTGFNSYIQTIQIQSDGKILVGGRYTTYNGVSKGRIIRLNSNGSIDNTFRMGFGFMLNTDVVNTIKIQPDGKILVSGFLGRYNSHPYFFGTNFMRLNSDGSIDATFTPFRNFLFSNSIQILSDGKILVGGGDFFLRLTENGLNSTDNGINFDKFFIFQDSVNNVNGIWLSPNDEVVKIKSFLPINKSMISYKLIKIK